MSVAAELPLGAATPATAERGWAAWRVVAGSAIVMAFSLAGMWSTTFSLFIAPFGQEFQWSRTEISLGITIMTLAAPFIAPLGGWAVDRWPLRALVIGSLLLQAALFAAMATLNGQLWMYYAVCLAAPLVGLGASALPLSKIVNTWFDAARGRALGFLFAAASVGIVAHPLVVQLAISREGWRAAYLVMAAMILVIGLPAALAWVRERKAVEVATAPAATRQLGAAEARVMTVLRQRAFWIVAVWAGLYGFGLGAVQFSLFPMLVSRGIEPTQAAASQSLISVGLVVGNLLAGVLLDKVNAARFASVVMLAPVAAVAMLALSDSASVGLAASGLLGIAAGGEASVLVYLASRLFAPAIYGRAYALLTVVLALLAGLGPLLGGWAFDHYGNYTLVLQASAAAFLLAAIAPFGLRMSRAAAS